MSTSNPALSAADFSAQMVAQLRVLDPAMSAEVGTPERKIIDTVATAISQTQIDLTALSGSLNIDNKFGADLDTFLALFGFARQVSSFATGFVTFSRQISSTLDIPINVGTSLLAPDISVSSTSTATFSQDIAFITTLGITLPAGQTQVSTPIQALIAGSTGNVPSGAISTIINQPVNGISAVINPAPTTGGLDAETDDEFKLRFKNTVFRNVSGTEDQYLALAIATAYTTKASCVGPISRYREYVQVPWVDDASTDPNNGYAGNGNAGEYTSALSTNPYSSYVYVDVPYFISNGQLGAGLLFYRQDTDFVLNNDATDKFRGDTYRQALLGSGANVSDPSTTFQPNVTFYNIYTGSDPSVDAIRPGDIVLLEYSYVCTESRNDPTRNVNNAVDVFIDGMNSISVDAVIPRPTIANVFNATSTDRYYYLNYRRVGEPNHPPVVGNLFTALFWQPVLSLPDQIIVGTTTYYNEVHYWAVGDVSKIGGTVRSRNGIEWHAGINGQGPSDPVDGPYTGPKIAANPEPTIEIDQYFYDRNLYDLQSAFDGAKQVTTDVLAHHATFRYFKFDITVMYAGGASKADVNNQISNALQIYFSSQYFGSVIQISDILNVIHNVSGVDNVRWSGDLAPTRHKVQETDINGVSLLNVVVDQVQAGAPSLPEIQQFYLTGNPVGGTFTLSLGNAVTAPIAYNAAPSQITATLALAPTVGNTSLTFAQPYQYLTTGMLVSLQGGTPESVTVTSLVSPTVVNTSAVGNVSHTTTVTYTPVGNIQTLAQTAGIPITVTGTGTVENPFIATFTSNGSQPGLLTPTVSFTTGSAVFDADFFLQDNELPALPSGIVSSDTSPGLIIRPRAQGTWGSL